MASMEQAGPARRPCTAARGWLGAWLACLLLLSVPGWARTVLPATPQPRQLTVADGLPSNSINDFAEDAYGYLWLATDDGLARYDGRSYRIWRIEDGLRDNRIWAVHVDERNRVWIGTENAGMVMLDAARQRFHFYDHRGYPQMLGGAVWCITSTPDGSIWFGTSASGLYRLPPDGKMQRFQPEPGNPRSLPDMAVNFLANTPDGTLWISTSNAVARWTGRDFERLALPPGRINNGITTEADGSLWLADSFGRMLVRRPDGTLEEQPWAHAGSGTTVLKMLLRDRSGAYWLDTLDGLGRAADGQLRNVPLYSVSAHGLVKPNWTSAYQDREGGLWFASPNTGLWHLPPNWQQFAVLANRREDPSTPANPYALAAANSADGRFWLVGTRGALDRLDPSTGAVEHHIAPIDGLKWPSTVTEDGNGRVWIGLRGSLVRYDPRDGAVRRWHDDAPVDPAPIEAPDLMRQVGDRLWLYSANGGFQVRDLEGRVRRLLPLGSHGLSQGMIVNDMRTGPDGTLWLGSSRGLLAWNEARDRFLAVPGTPGTPVYAFRVTDSGIAWLAGLGRLQQYLWQDGRLQLLDSIGAAQEFPVLVPGSLVVDPDGVAWLSSARGLIRVDPASRAIRVYGVHDGLPNQQFRPHTLLQSVKGQIMGATPDGLVLFDPSRVRPSTRQPPLMIERVGLRRGESGLDVTHMRPLVVQDGDRDLHIVARMLSFADSDSISYRFRLSGYDPDWVDVGSGGERLFSRLPAGHYTLEVQARTADSVWSKVQTLRFQVLPPWWRSPWGLLALALLAAAGIALAIMLYRRRLQRLHALQLAIHKQELAEQASLAKTRFLATLGHEVRTPMTGVLGMSELLLNTDLDERQRSYIDAIRRAGAHLLRLVNDALDLARIESGRLELDLQPFLVRQLVDEVQGLMEPLARDRGLGFNVEVGLSGDIVANGDATRVRQILLNLLGNAIKFTERGLVVLKLTTLGSHKGLRFEVADTGPGINAEQRERLFQRFEQGESARANSRYGGSGLGLAICQELAVAMGGHIEVVSRLGAGTRFIVDLPLRWVPAPVARDEAVARPIAPIAPLRILLVEDDDTVAEVIAGLLRAQGHAIVHAPHGLAALTETTEHHFDVALLDLDLPGLDGFALARQLRLFGHAMPLVAVTARSDERAEPAAREAGFDAFLRKPVTGEMLAEALAGVMRAAG